MDLRVIAGYACVISGSVTIVVALLLVVQRSVEPPESAESMMALGEERLAGGDLHGAAEWFRRAAEAAPDGGGAARVAEARVLELRGQTEAALEAYRQAAEREPGALAPALDLASALARGGQLEQAEAELERARRAHPEAPGPLVQLAALAIDRGDLEGAASTYRQLEELLPTDPRGALGVGAVAETTGDGAAAGEAYRRATVVDGSSVPAWEGVGRVAAAGGDFEGAEAAYRRVVELRPNESSARTVLATLVERRGRYEEAAGLFRRALELIEAEEEPPREGRALAWTGLGTCLLAMGRNDDAYEALASALTDDPDQPEALWALAPIYLERQEWEAATRAARRVIPRRGEDPMLWVVLGRAEAGQGHWTEARQSFLYALELDESHLEARRWLGVSLRALGVYRAAELTLEEVLRQRPDDDLATLNLAIAQGQLGQQRDARRHFASARRLMPGRAEPLYHEAHLLLALGQRAEALELAEEAVRVAPEDPAAFEVLARALDAAGRRADARRRAEGALERARDDAQRQYLRDLVSRLGDSSGDAS